MNHDYAHCADFTEKCPRSCFRAQLARDLKENSCRYVGMLMTYANFKGSDECPMPKPMIIIDEFVGEERMGMKLCDVEKDTLMKWLAKEPTEVIAIAYAYAKGINLYGVDVTKTWETAVQNTIALDKAYERGKVDESNAWLERLRKGDEDADRD